MGVDVPSIVVGLDAPVQEVNKLFIDIRLHPGIATPLAFHASP